MTATASIVSPLHRLGRRERLLALIWGLSRFAAVVLAGLIVACLIDWWIDRRHDTPMAVRVGGLALQFIVAGAAAAWFLLPGLRRRSDDTLALFVENRLPVFNH